MLFRFSSSRKEFFELGEMFVAVVFQVNLEEFFGGKTPIGPEFFVPDLLRQPSVGLDQLFPGFDPFLIDLFERPILSLFDRAGVEGIDVEVPFWLFSSL